MSYLSVCGTIGASIAIDCDNIPVNGTADRAIVMNRGDVDFTTSTTAADGSVTSLALKATKTAFQIDGLNFSITPNMSLSRQGRVSRYVHEIEFLTFKVDQATKNELEAYANGRATVVLETLDETYEVYGWDVGMRAEEITRAPNDQETNGLFRCVLRTPEGQPGEKKLPRDYLNTDYDTTTTQLNGLL
jgi:hypothetical protein